MKRKRELGGGKFFLNEGSENSDEENTNLVEKQKINVNKSNNLDNYSNKKKKLSISNQNDSKNATNDFSTPDNSNWSQNAQNKDYRYLKHAKKCKDVSMEEISFMNKYRFEKIKNLEFTSEYAIERNFNTDFWILLRQFITKLNPKRITLDFGSRINQLIFVFLHRNHFFKDIIIKIYNNVGLVIQEIVNHLDLSNTKLKDTSISTFYGTFLTSINLSHNEITESSTLRDLSVLLPNSIESINISNNKFRDHCNVPPIILEIIQKYNLKCLEIESIFNEYSLTYSEAISNSLSKSKTISKLKIGGNMGFFTEQLIIKILENKTIKNLSIKGSKLFYTSYELMKQKTDRQFWINNVDPIDSVKATLNDIKSCPKLTSFLKNWEYEIMKTYKKTKNDQSEDLIFAICNSNVKNIDISGNSMTIFELARLLKEGSFEVIKIKDNYITNYGLTLLRKYVDKLGTVKKIDISKNIITNVKEIANILRSSAFIKNIKIDTNYIIEEGLEEICNVICKNETITNLLLINEKVYKNLPHKMLYKIFNTTLDIKYIQDISREILINRGKKKKRETPYFNDF